MRKQIYIATLAAILLTSCNPNLEYDVRGYTQKIIVEGKIENHKPAEVFLTTNVPLWKKLDSTIVLDHVIRHAKVTLSDGESSEVLTSKWDYDKFPPFLYRSTEIYGEAGKTYSLTVEYGGYTLNSETSIPDDFELEQIVHRSADESTTDKKIYVIINNEQKPERSYRLFCKNPMDQLFTENQYLFNSSLDKTGSIEMQVAPAGQELLLQNGDTLDIKIMAIDSRATAFFKDLSLYAMTTNQFLLSEVKSLPSNISEPGFGVWYGSNTRLVRYIIENE